MTKSLIQLCTNGLSRLAQKEFPFLAQFWKPKQRNLIAVSMEMIPNLRRVTAGWTDSRKGTLSAKFLCLEKSAPLIKRLPIPTQLGLKSCWRKVATQPIKFITVTRLVYAIKCYPIAPLQPRLTVTNEKVSRRGKTEWLSYFVLTSLAATKSDLWWLENRKLPDVFIM